VSKAIRDRDGFTRDFGCDGYENLSGAISWLTFFAGGAADVRRSRSDWRRELAESTSCSQRKPRSFRCSAQPAGSRGVRRINVLAVSLQSAGRRRLQQEVWRWRCGSHWLAFPHFTCSRQAVSRSLLERRISRCFGGNTSGEAKGIGGGNSQNRRFVLSKSRGAFAVQPSQSAAAASGASMSWR
jgi:hypothetical protein